MPSDDATLNDAMDSDIRLGSGSVRKGNHWYMIGRSVRK